MSAAVRLERLVSGGQTGADRAALDTALGRGIACGGYCPKGRKAEDGPIAARYPLTETAAPSYIARTRRNVAESDATLVLAFGRLDRGSRAAIEIARARGRPWLALDLRREGDPGAVAAWLAAHGVRTLNVAGPRESRAPGTYAAAARFLGRLLDRIAPVRETEPTPHRSAGARG